MPEGTSWLYRVRVILFRLAGAVFGLVVSGGILFLGVALLSYWPADESPLPRALMGVCLLLLGLLVLAISWIPISGKGLRALSFLKPRTIAKILGFTLITLSAVMAIAWLSGFDGYGWKEILMTFGVGLGITLKFGFYRPRARS